MQACSCAEKRKPRTRHTYLGVPWKTAAPLLGGCSSGQCFTLAKSTDVQTRLGARPSKPSARTPANLPGSLSVMSAISQALFAQQEETCVLAQMHQST
jgi:hypothetical protein